MEKENGERDKSTPGDANHLVDPLAMFAGTLLRLICLNLNKLHDLEISFSNWQLLLKDVKPLKFLGIRIHLFVPHCFV